MKVEKKQYKVALFDLDGTLLDTSEGILCAVDEMVETCGLRKMTPEEKRSVIGPPVQKSVQRIYQLSEKESLEIASVFRKAYSEKYLMKAKPYEGIFGLLEFLRQNGWKTGIATYKRNDYAQLLMKEIGLLDLCDYALGSDGADQTKAQIIQCCLDKLGGVAGNSIMVGDTMQDLIGAEQAGLDFIGITFGFGFRTCEEILANGAIAAAESAFQLQSVFAELS